MTGGEGTLKSPRSPHSCTILCAICVADPLAENVVNPLLPAPLLLRGVPTFATRERVEAIFN